MTERIHKEAVEKAGAKFIGMPLAFDPKGAKLYDFHPELKSLTGIKQIEFYINERFLKMTLPSIELINELRNEFIPDLYISCPCTYAPIYLSEKFNKPGLVFHMLPLGIPSKDHAPFGTGELPSNSRLSKIKYKILNHIIAKHIFKSTLKKANRIRKEVEIKPYANFFYDFYDNPDKVLATSIPEFDYYRSDLPSSIEYIGPILPTKSNDFITPKWWPELDSGKKIVLVNQGTLSMDISDLILPTIEALRNEDCIVIAVPVKEEIKDLPDNVRISEFVPFASLLPHVDIMITNGGFGATQMALAHGIPLILGGNTVDDKMEISARVAYTGCGIDIKSQKTKSSAIKKACDQINSDGNFKENAMKMKKVIASYNPIKKANSIIEELLEKSLA